MSSTYANLTKETRVEQIRKIMAEWHPVRAENNEAFHCKADIEFLLAKIDDLQALNQKAAAVLSKRMCPVCEGAGQIVHGTSPDNEWAETCPECKDDHDLIEQLDPPAPTEPAHAEVGDDIQF